MSKRKINVVAYISILITIYDSTNIKEKCPKKILNKLRINMNKSKVLRMQTLFI